jgi:hypothetical protein
MWRRIYTPVWRRVAVSRAEKQTVKDQRRSAATVATTVAKPSDGARRMWTTLECRPSLRPVTDGPGRLAHSYGSKGWGFESLRARPAQRPLTQSGRGLSGPPGSHAGSRGARQPPNRPPAHRLSRRPLFAFKAAPAAPLARSPGSALGRPPARHGAPRRADAVDYPGHPGRQPAQQGGNPASYSSGLPRPSRSQYAQATAAAWP